jgi:AcrR family transcriptional regulator
MKSSNLASDSSPPTKGVTKAKGAHSAVTPNGLSFLRRKPLQARGNQRVLGILRACEALLGELTAEEITIEKIAARAGVQVGSVYFFFSDRLSIFFSLIELVLGEVEAAYTFSDSDVQAPTLQFLERLEKKLARLWEEHRTMLDLYFSYSTHPSITPILTKMRNHVDTQLAQKLGRDFPSFDKNQKAAMVRVVNGLLMCGLDLAYEIPRASAAAFHKEWFLALRLYIDSLGKRSRS